MHRRAERHDLVGVDQPGRGFRSNVFSTNLRTAGVLVAPPTSRMADAYPPPSRASACS